MSIGAHASGGPSTALTRVRELGKALSDPSRLRILGALKGRELCVCHLVSMLDVDASNVSRHVSALRRAGLLSVRKEGRWLHCQRADPDATLWAVVDEMLAGAPELSRDREALDTLFFCHP